MNDDAYRDAVHAHAGLVHGYATRILGDREDARDVAQEALVRLWTHRSGVEAEGARTWLLHAAHNLCLDRLRARSVRGDQGDDALGVLPCPAPDPERLAAARQTGAAIERALATLPARERAVLLLRETHGLSYEEIAAILGAPLGTLKALLHRARERARLALLEAGVRP